LKPRLFVVVLIILCSDHAFAGKVTPVTVAGLGKAKFGMTLEQLNRAFGERFTTPSEEDVYTKSCFYVTPNTLPGTRMMIEDGRLTRIDITSRRYTTSDGLGIGADRLTMKSRYGSRLTDEPHYYEGPEGRYLTLDLNKSISVRFEIWDERVNHWYVGRKQSVQYVEGCL
jgi:hypothetical protein